MKVNLCSYERALNIIERGIYWAWCQILTKTVNKIHKLYIFIHEMVDFASLTNTIYS